MNLDLTTWNLSYEDQQNRVASLEYLWEPCSVSEGTSDISQGYPGPWLSTSLECTDTGQASLRGGKENGSLPGAVVCPCSQGAR